MNVNANGQRLFWKRLLRRLIILLVMIFLIFQSAQLWQYFNTGADRSEILFKTFGQVKQVTHYVQWSENQPEGAPQDEYSKKKIGETYSEAWSAWNTYLSSRREEVLYDYFADSLVSRITGNTSGHRIERSALSHNIEPLLYSLDKQVLVFRDKEVPVYRHIYREEKLMGTDQEVADFLVVMALIEGKWYIKYIKKMPPGDRNEKRTLSNLNRSIGIDKDGFLVDRKPFDIKGINYYPQNAPWSEFWLNYDEETTKTDLVLIRELGFNSVRFFIPYFDVDNDTLAMEKLAAIESFLEVSQTSGIYVLPTLFDFPKSYDIRDFPAFDAYLRKIIILADEYDHILAWDIKNEPDLDFRIYGEEKVSAWLDFIIDRCRYHDPARMLTIGWSDPSFAHLHGDDVDFISFHFYKEVAELGNGIERLRKRVVGKKHLVLSEFGRSSFNPWWFLPGYSQKEQADYVKDIVGESTESNVTTFYWCLYDYPELPQGIFGWKPWIKGSQRRFGLIDEAGNQKPVVQSFTD